MDIDDINKEKISEIRCECGDLLEFDIVKSELVIIPCRNCTNKNLEEPFKQEYSGVFGAGNVMLTDSISDVEFRPGNTIRLDPAGVVSLNDAEGTVSIEYSSGTVTKENDE